MYTIKKRILVSNCYIDANTITIPQKYTHTQESGGWVCERKKICFAKFVNVKVSVPFNITPLQSDTAPLLDM